MKSGQIDHNVSKCWFTPDPAEQFHNPYLAMGNNPVMYVDPDGEFVIASAIIIGAMIGSFTGAVSAGYSGATNGQIMASFGIVALAGAVSGGVGKGVNVAFAGGSFGAGFSGTAAGVSSSGIISGAATGGAAGLTNGFITGFGNQLVRGENFGNAFNLGLDQAWKQGLIGAAAGGVLGGIDAVKKDLKLFTGKADLDLSEGFGAHGIEDFAQRISGKYVGTFEGVDMYEAQSFATGDGITLPGRGIIVSEGAFSRNLDPWLVKHEFGHILQARVYGMSKFYGHIAPRSLISANKNGVNGWRHSRYWTEVMANKMSSSYFHIYKAWPYERFPLIYQNYDWVRSFYDIPEP